jgi:ammonium transporter, Amt family
MMSSFAGKESYLPDYASYNWIGAPSNYGLSTNAALGGDPRM